MTNTDRILIDVAQTHRLRVSDLQHPRRNKLVVRARKEAIRRLAAAGYSCIEIGQALHRHHTTVLHHLERLGYQR